MARAWRTGSGRRRHLVSLYALGEAVPDGDGGFTQAASPLSPPTAYAAIEPATARALERLMAGTVIAEATHIVTLPYHPEVSTNTTLLYKGRRFDVVGLANPEERSIETIAVCKEQLNLPAIAATSSWVQEGWIG